VDVEEEDARVSGGWSPDFHWVTDELAVGGAFPSKVASELALSHAIRAVVDLRAEDCDDQAVLGAAGIDLLHLPTPDLEPASHEHLDKGVDFVRERMRRGEKVLVHCQHGIGRSALLALCVMVDDGWEPLQALEHMKDRREIVSPSLSQYQGWSRWLASRGIESPDYHSFGCIAYRHLAKS
jgi:protein-tyrosine phosphatase